jgi:hypothetical protein
MRPLIRFNWFSFSFYTIWILTSRSFKALVRLSYFKSNLCMIASCYNVFLESSFNLPNIYLSFFAVCSNFSYSSLMQEFLSFNSDSKWFINIDLSVTYSFNLCCTSIRCCYRSCCCSISRLFSYSFYNNWILVISSSLNISDCSL